MYYSFAQIIVLARGNDIEGWMDILILVVIAVVYGLGALIRAKGKKSEEQAHEQQTRKPQRKPSSGGRGFLEQFIRDIQKAAEEAKSGRESSPRSQTILQKKAHPQTQSVLQKYAAESSQESSIQPIIAPVKPKPSKPTKQVQSDLEIFSELDKVPQEFPEFTTKSFGLPDNLEEMPAEVIDSIYLSDVLSDYKDPEELKKAILHYEILGRPLSLRDSSKDIIGL